MQIDTLEGIQAGLVDAAGVIEVENIGTGIKIQKGMREEEMAPVWPLSVVRTIHRMAHLVSGIRSVIISSVQALKKVVNKVA